MNDAGHDPLQQAEQLLKEGKKQAATALLAGYLQGHPNSARAWWLLSFALPDVNKQIDCLERALRIEPQAPQVIARLQKLKGTLAIPAFVPPFVDSDEVLKESHPLPAQRQTPSKPVPVPKPVAPVSQPLKVEQPVSTPAMPKKKKGKGMQMAIFAGLGVFAVVVLGIVSVMVMRGLRTSAPSAPMESVTQILLPPTWTPTATPTLRPSLTPFVTVAPATPTSAFVTPQAQETVPASKIGPYVGYRAPNFTLNDVNQDSPISLSSHSGNVVLVLFWTTTCAFCEAQMSALQMIYQVYADDGLTVLAVNSGERENIIQAFGNAHLLTFNLLSDSGRDVSTNYELTAYPTMFFVDRSGVITYISIGMTDYWKMKTEVETMLGIQ